MIQPKHSSTSTGSITRGPMARVGGNGLQRQYFMETGPRVFMSHASVTQSEVNSPRDHIR